MKALTVWQPWATLIAAGHKPYEFRGVTSTTWMKPAIGQRIAIHAGMRKGVGKEVEKLLKALHFGPRPALAETAELYLATKPVPTYPMGCFVCTAVVGEPVRGDEAARRLGMDVNDSDRPHTFNWGWPLTGIQTVPAIPCRGFQGLWNVPADIARDIA